MGTGSFPGVKRTGRGFDHPPQSRTEVKEKVVIYLYSHLKVFVACSKVKLTQPSREEAEIEVHILFKRTETDRWTEKMYKWRKKSVQKISNASNTKTL
jgi:hypothetical protein